MGPMLAMALACTGKDYQVFQIAAEFPELDADCYDGTIPNDVAADEYTLQLGSTLIVFAGPNDTWFAETGGLALPGARDGKGYAFDGDVVDVIEFGNATATYSQSLALELTIDGKFVSGTYKTVSEYTCEGPEQACGDDSTCTASTAFGGVRVDDDVPADDGGLGYGYYYYGYYYY